MSRLAIVWLAIGVLSLFGLKLKLLLGAMSLNLGLLGFIFGPGLFLGRPWARTCLVWLTRLGFLVVIVIAFASMNVQGPAAWVGYGISVTVMGLLVLQRQILFRPDVQRFFDPYGRVE